MPTRTVTQTQPPAQKSRARALSLALVAPPRTAPLLDIPTELGLEILELGLTHTPFTTLAAVSPAFCALISKILYRNVVLDSVETMSLFYRTTKTKSSDFLDAHIKTLAVTIEPWRFTAATRIELEGIVAACTGLRALSVTRPGILGEPLSHRVLPSEVTIQSFDATPPFQWVRSAAALSASCPTHLSASITHLRISEPGETWHSPLSILTFFGSTPHLTHLALARRTDANTDNDEIFVDEVCTLLATRRTLKMVVVRIFPAHWPHYFDSATAAESSSIWAALASVAEADQRLVLVSAGFNGCLDSVPGPERKAIARVGKPSAFPDFWKRSRKDWETRGLQDLEQ
ncbi:hypothetical protein K438DRAFT_1844177 [Mycena galopus ATCC 62051]|nr:hypothetical protein K438DRAFT_1844177 [Mycena galopus ATCC 62051]